MFIEKLNEERDMFETQKSYLIKKLSLINKDNDKLKENKQFDLDFIKYGVKNNNLIKAQIEEKEKVQQEKKNTATKLESEVFFSKQQVEFIKKQIQKSENNITKLNTSIFEYTKFMQEQQQELKSYNDQEYERNKVFENIKRTSQNCIEFTNFKKDLDLEMVNNIKDSQLKKVEVEKIKKDTFKIDIPSERNNIGNGISTTKSEFIIQKVKMEKNNDDNKSENPFLNVKINAFESQFRSTTPIYRPNKESLQMPK